MLKSEPIHIIRIGVDVLLLLLTVTAWVLVHYAIPQRKSGFYCNDYSIALPYKDSTVSNNALILICTVFPTLIVVVTELCRKYSSNPKAQSRKQFKYKIKFLRRKNPLEIPEIVGNIYITLGTHMFGLLIVQFLTNLLKFTVGRLRPHFLDICQPEFMVKSHQGIQLKSADCAFQKYYQYDLDFKCTTNNQRRLFDASLSFPSGHSSTVFYTMVFFVLYIRYIWRCENSKMKNNCGFAILFTQCLLLTAAVFTAVSRVFDHKHHVTDVIAGSIIGIFFAVFIFFLFTEFLSRKNNNLQLKDCSFSAQTETNSEFINVGQFKAHPTLVDHV
jgi:phosphatidate phosphatase